MSLRLAIKRSLEGSSDPEPPRRVSIPDRSEEGPPSSSSSSSSFPPAQPPPQPRLPSIHHADIIMAKKKAQRRRRIHPRQEPAAVVKLPKIEKCTRNDDPDAIDEYGFVEISSALPPDLIGRIYDEAALKVARHEERKGSRGGSPKKKLKHARRTPLQSQSSSSSTALSSPQSKSRPQSSEGEVEEISNALQVDVSEGLLRSAKSAMENCDAATRTMAAVFGRTRGRQQQGDSESNYAGFVLETPKVLITRPGSNPQLPHADDHCTSCVICLLHLRDGQEPTRVARYEGRNKDYPTGITVGCDECERMEQLPDDDFRRGVHLTTEKWTCTDGCSSPHTPYDFEGKLTSAFSELLDPDAPDLCDAYAGRGPRQSAGDGILGVPTLVHRGPGNASDAGESRYVLFLTLRPVYRNAKGAGTHDHHKYNPALQIHASCILYNQFKKVNSIYERGGCGLEGYFGAIVGSETASLMNEVKRLREENRRLREKANNKNTGKQQKQQQQQQQQQQQRKKKKKQRQAAVAEEVEEQKEKENGREPMLRN